MLKKIVLASTSPFRKAQLEQLGFEFFCEKPLVNERALEDTYTGELHGLPVFLAKAKAQSVAISHSDAIVIGCDQLLIFNGQAFHKPENFEEVIERLMQMQGQTHELHTGLCLLQKDEIQTSTTIACMTMRPLSESQIRSYVEQDQPMGCAGGYKIEKKGPLLFSKIETNDHSSIVGLPTLSLIQMLEDWGISRL